MSTLLNQPALAAEGEFPDEHALREPYWSRRRIILGLLALWVLSGIFLVAPDQQAVVTRFGAVNEPRVMPGIHYALPWPIDSVTKLKVQQLQRLVIGGDIPDTVLGRSNPLASQFITGDQNIINMRVVVQYYVGVPADYLFRTQDVGKAIGAAVEAELARRVAHSGVDDVLTTQKVAIQDETRAAAQKRINDYHAGVILSTVNIENVTPPAEAADAFRDVTNARADTTRIVNEAEGYANDLIPRARGEAQQLIESADAYKLSKVNDAAGDASRFDQMEAEYAKASEVTGRRLYIETMEQILPKIKKMIVDPDGNLDLTILRKGDPAPTPEAMSIDRKKIATVVVLLGAFALVWGQKKGWQFSNVTDQFSQISLKPQPKADPTPQDTIYGMLDAARAGDVKAYLSNYSGQMTPALQQSVTETTEPKFAQYLKDSNAAIKGVAISEPQQLSDTQVKVRVEYVYQDRNEAQFMYLEKQSGVWKIVQVDSTERVKTLVPYGTPVQ